ncbi:MAG: antitoxin Xre-like helix-turn-helix domain-containing protein [Pseudomonadota bacterium]
MKLQPIDRAPPSEAAPTFPFVGGDYGISDEEGLAMAEAAVNLFRHWGLTDHDACTLLGGISVATYNRWKRGEIGRLTVDQKTRLSVLMGVHKALRILYTENARSYAWIKKPNRAFDGKAPLEIMMQGQIMDLFDVRFYLDAARG